MTQSHWLRRSQKDTHARNTHREEACRHAKMGGNIKKGPFRLSPLDSVSAITDGVLSLQPTMFVSIASPPPVVNTHSNTHTFSPFAEERKQERTVQKSFCWGSFPKLFSCIPVQRHQERFQLDCCFFFLGGVLCSLHTENSTSS